MSSMMRRMQYILFARGTAGNSTALHITAQLGNNIAQFGNTCDGKMEKLTSVSLTGGDHAVPPTSSILMISMLLSWLKARSHPIMYVPVQHGSVQLS